MAGAVVGFLALPLLAGLALAVLMGVLLADETKDTSGVVPAGFWTDGADISQNAGTIVVVRGTNGAITRQTCRETCDDLTYWSGAAQSVEVRTADGQCLLCQEQGLRLPFTAPKRWGLGGKPLELYERPWR